MKELSSIDTNDQQSKMPVEKTYSLKEAAPLLGVSVSTLRNWLREKPPRIDYQRVGEKLIKIRESEILRVNRQSAEQNTDMVAGMPREEFQKIIREVLQEPEMVEMIRSIAKRK